MLVSVCIPTFNGERFIRQTIQSVLDQSYRNFELVISDHSSTDRTLEIVGSFEDARIRVVSASRNLSIADNWNLAVASARGSLVKVMGQDDILYSGALAIEMAEMRDAAVTVGFCYSDRDLLSRRGRVVRRRRVKSVGNRDSRDLVRRIVRFGGNPIGEPVAVLFRWRAWQEVGGFRGTYIIDLDFYTRVLTRYVAVSTGACIGAFRVHNSSWGAKLFTRQLEVMKFLYQLRSIWSPFVRPHDMLIGSIKVLVRTSVRIIFQQLLR